MKQERVDLWSAASFAAAPAAVRGRAPPRRRHPLRRPAGSSPASPGGARRGEAEAVEILATAEGRLLAQDHDGLAGEVLLPDPALLDALAGDRRRRAPAGRRRGLQRVGGVAAGRGARPPRRRRPDPDDRARRRPRRARRGAGRRASAPCRCRSRRPAPAPPPPTATSSGASPATGPSSCSARRTAARRSPSRRRPGRRRRPPVAPRRHAHPARPHRDLGRRARTCASSSPASTPGGSRTCSRRPTPTTCAPAPAGPVDLRREDALPSDYVRRHVFATFGEDRFAALSTRYFGPHHLLWSAALPTTFVATGPTTRSRPPASPPGCRPRAPAAARRRTAAGCSGSTASRTSSRRSCPTSTAPSSSDRPVEQR